MTGSILDILIYVFDRYMLDVAPEVPERAHLARELEGLGFGRANVERALDWLTDLAFGGQSIAATQPGNADGAPLAMRLFTDSEQARLSRECRGLLLELEAAHVLTASQRELVIERMLALDADAPDTEQLKWVVLMVLSSQPGQEQAVERFGALVADRHVSTPH